MNASWRIFINDMKNIATNWVVAILIGGLTILPSLYAWFNIKASWDPYSHTDQIPIGIVNEDEGAIVRDQEIHVGDDLVETLREHKSMDWQFVNRNTAMDKLKYGDYFAVIIIPNNFSKRLGSVISDYPEKADVEYYVNEKINAIAPKITEKGASVIVEQISSNFISTVNGIIFDLFNKIGIELEENLPDIEKFESYIFLLEEKLPEINKIVNETVVDANRAATLINQVQELVPKANDAATSGLQIIDETTKFLQEAEERLDEIAPRVKDDLAKIESIVSQTNEYVSGIDATKFNLTEENQILSTLNGQIDKSLQSIETIESVLRQFQNQNNEVNEPQSNIDQALNELNRLNQSLNDLQQQTTVITTFLEGKQTEFDGFLSDIKERTATVKEQVDAFVKEYDDKIEPTIREEVTNTKEVLAQARGILVDIQSTIPEVENILSRTGRNLSEGTKILDTVSGEFPYVNDKVNELANRLRAIQDKADINEIIQLLQNNPEAERGFFAEPVLLKEHSIFTIPNYGTGMTPFYTVLAIWVGGLLLISLLSTDVHQKDYTGRQIYFGRLLTFLAIGFFQALIVALGNILLLHVEVKEPFWFVLFGLLCSTIFIIIVYTLVSVFGNVGKAFAIILLVLQIAGSGGTYPVVLLPNFFQIINPFLPFTYAIDLMREAVGGIIWEKVFYDVSFLLLFGLLALALGLFLRDMINRKAEKFKKKSKESGLFH